MVGFGLVFPDCGCCLFLLFVQSLPQSTSFFAVTYADAAFPADVLRGSSRVPPPITSADLSGKNVDQSQQTSRSGKRTLDLAKCRTWIPDNLHVISSWYLRTMGKEFIFQFSRRKWNRNAWRTPEKVYVGGVLYHWTSKHEKLLAQQKIVFPRWPNKTFLDTVNK